METTAGRTLTLERRMTRLARLYAARDRRIRLQAENHSGYYARGIWNADDAINRTKTAPSYQWPSHAYELLSAARRLDCWKGDYE